MGLVRKMNGGLGGLVLLAATERKKKENDALCFCGLFVLNVFVLSANSSSFRFFFGFFRCFFVCVLYDLCMCMCVCVCLCQKRSRGERDRSD